MKLKVISLNTWHGGELFDEMLAWLHEQKADILMLQEVFNEHDPEIERRYRVLDVLQAELGLEHAAFGAEFVNVRRGELEEGNAVLSRWPITASEVIFVDGAYDPHYIDAKGNFGSCPRSLQHVVVVAPEMELKVFNLHGVWDLDGDNFSEKRRKMSEMVIRSVKDKRNVILAGDSNAKHTNQAMRAIEEYLTPAFEPDIVTTFNMRRKSNPGYATAAVDLMYVSREIKVLSHDCPDVDISDHRPVVAELEVSDQ